MARTLLLYSLSAFLVATYWARLEHGGQGEGLLWVAALALAPALVRPLWARLAVLALASALAVRIALHVSPLDARPGSGHDFFGPAGEGFWNGFAAFFDVVLPFRPTDHPAMHGVLLLAVFGFCAVLALAIAARRPLLASAALVAGAGWPATIMTGGADLGRGAVLLSTVLLLFAGLRAYPTRDVRQPVLAGAAVVGAALVLTTSPSVARGEFVQGWREWNVDVKGEPSLGVEYVWNSNYSGIRFPEKPTTVLTIAAPADGVAYWRATTLDAFSGGRWSEELIGIAAPLRVDGRDELANDPFLPAAARDPDNWIRAHVTVEALRDVHLTGASVPVAYDAPDDRSVEYTLGNVAMIDGGTDRGDQYTVWSYSPQPGPAQLSRSKPSYPELVRFGPFLSFEDVVLPAFGEPGRERFLEDMFQTDPRLRAYEQVYRTARRVVGRPPSPYAAVVALETWFRSGGDFVYDERPPRVAGRPALASFVTRTKRGYCQHFAGAMALMLRQLGIPARVAAGFTAGQYDRDEGRWIVADRNAHTWVEAWFQGFGWLPFDPTPGRGRLSAPYTSSSVQFDVAGARDAIGDAASDAVSALLLQARGRQAPQTQNTGSRTLASFRDDRPGGARLIVLLTLLAAVAAALLAAAKLVRREVRFLGRDPRRLAGACRRDLVGFVADQGVALPDSATPRELGRTVEREFGIDTGHLVEALTLARYGPPEEASGAAAQARLELRRVRRALRARLSVPRRARGLVSLRSLTA